MTKSLNCYTDDLHYLRDELHRLDGLLRLAVQRARASGKDSDPFEGLYISDEDADHLLEEGIPLGHNILSSSSKAFLIQSAKASSGQKEEGNIPNGNEPRLRKLAETFSLSHAEIDAVLICLAVELDTKYEKLYAYLQDDLTRKRPTLGFIIDLFCTSPEEKITIRRLFLPGAPLFKHGIIEPAEEREGCPNLTSALRLNTDVLAYILNNVLMLMPVRRIPQKGTDLEAEAFSQTHNRQPCRYRRHRHINPGSHHPSSPGWRSWPSCWQRTRRAPSAPCRAPTAAAGGKRQRLSADRWSWGS